ncbi:MAG: ATP-binding cassette domain-containing protein [Clostridia bacterium]|nr:ATP-binding cassette domain-containing protein [Clostridia bacterium]
MSKIVFKNVDYAYKKGAPKVLDSICLEIESGSFVCVIGANGSGKTTFSKLINGMLIPTSGSVFVDNLCSSQKSDLLKIRQKVGLVFQNPLSSFVSGVVKDDVAFGPQNLNLPQEEVEKRVHDALDAVHMLDQANSEIMALSGGQQQRVALAGMLAMHAQNLVLDESFAMLDQRGRRGLMRLLNEFHAQGITVILVTHSIEDATNADKIIVLDQGKILMQGSPAQVFTKENAAKLREVNLGIPSSAKIALELIDKGFEFENLPLNNEELVEAILKKS